jgi:hypothetical protein
VQHERRDDEIERAPGDGQVLGIELNAAARDIGLDDMADPPRQYGTPVNPPRS